MKKFRRLLYRTIVQSLNSDQVDLLGSQVEGGFNLRDLAGFPDYVPIPSTTAADIVLKHFNSTTMLIRFLEVMLRQDGKFLYDSIFTFRFKKDLIESLAKQKWIFDPDTLLFFLDPFFVDEINFLKSVSMIDLRHKEDTEAIVNEMEQSTSKLKDLELEWSINIRLYGLDPHSDKLLRSTIEFLLARQDLKKYAYNCYFCLRELAVNSCKAGFKAVYERHLNHKLESGDNPDYAEFIKRFRDEIANNRAELLMDLARKEDFYFDIFLKSNEHSISFWSTNYTRISKIEKVRLIERLHLDPFTEDRFGSDNDEFAEGGGMGIMMTLNIIKSMYSGPDPLKLVFYPDKTKAGFTLFRSDLAAARDNPDP